MSLKSLTDARGNQHEDALGFGCSRKSPEGLEFGNAELLLVVVQVLTQLRSDQRLAIKIASPKALL